MVFRRPYAFMIKHFRLIHIILFLLMAYVTFKGYAVLDFFKSYIKNKGVLEFSEFNLHIFFVYLAVILIIIISTFIYFLMKYKKKPNYFYINIIIALIVSSFVFGYLNSNITALETTIMSAKDLRILRDISRFNYLVLFIECIPILIRGLGFDIKKFNFNRDLEKLKLEEKDNEEVEVNVSVDSDVLGRAGRKTKRELKYYYVENKFFINIILAIVSLIIIIPTGNFIVKSIPLKENDKISARRYDMIVTDSFTSDRMKTSLENNYIILKIKVKSNYNNEVLDMDKLVLKGKYNTYVPSYKYYYYFRRDGKGYKDNILTKDYTEYLLIYNVDKKDISKKLFFKNIDANKKVRIKPTILE